MRRHLLFLIAGSVFALQANADWYLRGTHNSWAAESMTDVGSNTVLADDVKFITAGKFKFDRFGDWSENYGVGGRDGDNIDIAAGVWDIEFYTDTKKWKIAPVSISNQYHFRGTANNWVEETLLTKIAGTNDYEICVEFKQGDVDGEPRFKIDPDGGWGNDAFPIGDYIVSSGFTHIIVDGNTSSIKSVTEGLEANCTGIPAADFRSRTIYFMFVDRFHNGDTSNDKGNNPLATSNIGSSGDITEWKKYWGGDVQGIIDKLDYLQALGVSAIWVTPLINNIDDSNDSGAYHGYWGRDFYEVDEHLGDWALIDKLDEEMEARDMKLVLDIALNHSNQDSEFEFGALYKEGVFLANETNDDGTWYHHNGAIADCGDQDVTTNCPNEWNEPEAFRNKTLFNLSDFNHGVSANSIADKYLIDAALKWMEHGVDAFRIDAIKHMEPNFINRFSKAVRAVNPEIYIFGEWYDAGANDALSMQFLNEHRGSELLDFNVRDNIEKAIANEIAMSDLSNHIKVRPSVMNGVEDWQPIFLDNHDAARTSVYLQTTDDTGRGNGKGFSKSLADARQNVGTALVMTLPGIPTIYYGTEHNSTWFGTAGSGQVGTDPYNRESMPSFSQNTTAFKMISALSKLRAKSPAIARGTFTEKWQNQDILVFERNEGDDAVVVAVNVGEAKTINVSALGLANGTYVSVVGSDVVSVNNGNATFHLDANEIVVLHK